MAKFFFRFRPQIPWTFWLISGVFLSHTLPRKVFYPVYFAPTRLFPWIIRLSGVFSSTVKVPWQLTADHLSFHFCLFSIISPASLPIITAHTPRPLCVLQRSTKHRVIIKLLLKGHHVRKKNFALRTVKKFIKKLFQGEIIKHNR